MRDYGVISPAFWTGETGKEIAKAGPECVVVAMHLMTSPHTNALGHYYIPVPFIAHETGLSLEGASKALQRVCETGFCAYDEKTEVIWVYEMARHQIANSLKPNDKRVKWVNNQYASLIKSPFLYDLYLKYKEVFHLQKPRGIEGPSKGLTMPHRSQEQEQEQEQDMTKSCPPDPPPADQPPAASLISSDNSSNHFRDHVGGLLGDLKQACEELKHLPEKENNPCNPYQVLQWGVNEGLHPGAILEVLREMIRAWDTNVINPWGFFKSVCRTRSKNFYEREAIYRAEDYNATIADLAASDLFRSLGLHIRRLKAG